MELFSHELHSILVNLILVKNTHDAGFLWLGSELFHFIGNKVIQVPVNQVRHGVNQANGLIIFNDIGTTKHNKTI